MEKEDDINWALLEKVFLGDDWDKEIRELAVKVRDGGELKGGVETRSLDQSVPWQWLGLGIRELAVKVR